MNESGINLNYVEKVRLKFSAKLMQSLNVALVPVPDGNIHRFDDPNGVGGNLACWYVLNMDPSPHGAYGNWRTGEKYNFQFDQISSLSPKQQADLNQKIRLLKERKEIAKLISHSKAAESAFVLWVTSRQADNNHPYLRRKNISAHDLRVDSSKLLVPLFDKSGKIVNVQSISANGAKRFMRGGRVKGCYSQIGTINGGETIYVCEGLATGATLHEITQLPVVCAMSCGNLLEVGKVIRELYPDSTLVIAGDDDRTRKGNPGLTAAIAAALELSCSVILPEWPSNAPIELSDFNDLYCWSVNHGAI